MKPEEENTDNKPCSICKGYGVYNGCSECGKISDAFWGTD